MQGVGRRRRRSTGTEVGSMQRAGRRRRRRRETEVREQAGSRAYF